MGDGDSEIRRNGLPFEGGGAIERQRKGPDVLCDRWRTCRRYVDGPNAPYVRHRTTSIDYGLEDADAEPPCGLGNPGEVGMHACDLDWFTYVAVERRG